LLVSIFLGILILPVQIPAQETCAGTYSRPKTRVAGDRPDDGTTGRTASPSGQRTLLRLTHPSAPTEGDQCRYDKAYSQISHRRFLTK
jgi:hypothetical protein